ncbi:MAG: hypothetical protein HY689_13145 [Chloroflexi bacterium]|nr:hypothetical protein [Chloroflexota bacterium]
MWWWATRFGATTVQSFDFPDDWWGGGFWWGREFRSVLDLMDEGTLDAPLAALLWLAIERHASLVVVGGHAPGVGKTTLLTALLAFLAPEATPVFTAGQRETFAFVERTDPARTRILVNEISDHLPGYLWGRQAATVFDLAGRGYALAATMHAASLDELVGQLEPPPVGVPRRTFAQRVPLTVLLAAGYQERRLVRRVTSVLLLRPGEDAAAVHADPLSTWDAATDTYDFTDQQAVWVALAARLRLPVARLRREREARSAYLTALGQEGTRDYDAVRAAVLRYHQA